MQHLGEKWLRLLNWYYFVYLTVFAGIYVYFAITQQTVFVEAQDIWGTSILTGVFAFLGVAYNLFILGRIKKTNVWFAYLFSFIFFAGTNAVATEIALESSSELFFLINTYSLIILSVSLGPIVALALIGITTVIFSMVIAGTTQPTSFGLTFDALTYVARVLSAILLLIVFRNKFISESSNQNSYIENYFVRNEVVRLLTNSIGDGVIIIDNREVVKSVNPAALEILNKAAQDVTDLNYRSVLKFKNPNSSNVSPENEPISKSLKTQKSIRQELLLQKNGKDIFIDLTVSPIANDQTQELYGAVIILRDVSKKKKEEAARSEFISTASHEMRTPVAAIEGYLALALNPKVAQIDPKIKSFLEKAYVSTQHLGRLFQDLLISTRAEDGRLVSHPEVTEIGAILDRQVDYFNVIANKKGLELEYIVGSQPQGGVKNVKPLYYTYADPARIEEVTTNLIDNAIKYTEAGKVTIGLTGDTEVVQFFIRDTGVGINTEDVPHLFQKFYRVDSSATRTTGGTGLGLFICRKIIELYEGRIWVQSAKGQGSTFYINLPRLDASQAESLKMRDATKRNRT